MTIIEQIKAEIERRRDSYLKMHGKYGRDADYIAATEDLRLLEFLSTLEKSEKPMNPDDAMRELDEKIALVKQRGTWDGVDVDKYMDEVRGREPEKRMELEEEISRTYHDGSVADTSDIDHVTYENVARHFAKWGYLRAAEKYNEIEYNRQRAEECVPNDLDEAANKFAVFYDQGTCDGIARDCFKAGAEWAMHYQEKKIADAYEKGKQEGIRIIRSWESSPGQGGY